MTTFYRNLDTVGLIGEEVVLPYTADAGRRWYSSSLLSGDESLVSHQSFTDTSLAGRGRSTSLLLSTLTLWHEGSHYQLGMKALVPYVAFSDTTLLEGLGCFVTTWQGWNSSLPTWSSLLNFFYRIWLE